MNNESGKIEVPVKGRYDSFALLLFVFALLVNSASWVLLFWKIPQTDGTIFLHYNVYYGIDLTGKWQQLFLLPGSGLAILVINTILGFRWWLHDTFMQRLFCAITLLFQGMLFVGIFLIVLLNAQI